MNSSTTPGPDDDQLLVNVYRALARWPGWTPGHSYKDDYGRYAFAATGPRGPYLCAAKKELFDGHASFMARKVVERAVDTDRLLCLFVGAPPTPDAAFVFDPKTVQRVGEEAELTSKRGGRVTVLQLNASEWGVLLGDWTSRRVGALPSAEPGYDGTLAGWGVKV